MRFWRQSIPILVTMILASAYGQTVTFSKFTPQVIRNDETSQILLEATVSGAPTRVALDLDPAGTLPLVDLVDNGANGDKVAGDGIYSVLLTPAQVVQGLTDDDVFRHFVGFLRLFQGATVVESRNIFAEIYTPAIPLSPVQVLAPDLQATDYVVNIVDANYSPDFNFQASQQTVTHRLYQQFGDAYDLLNLVTPASLSMNRYHIGTKNGVQGIGLFSFDTTALWGSSGHLLGVSFFPISSLFDGSNKGFVHEFGHQWAQFLTISPFAQGVPHWPISTMAHGIMGFTIPNSGNAGGDYPCKVVPDTGGVRLLADNTPKSFTDFDLYLMGFLPANQVGRHIVFNDQSDPTLFTCNGQLYTGGVTLARASDVVNALGPRVPNAANSQKQFRTATVVVSSNALLSQEAMSLYTFFAKRAEAAQTQTIHEGLVKGTGNPFFVATAGLGTLTASLVTFAPASLPDGAFGTVFSQQLTESRLHDTASWTLSLGSLPTGLSLSSDGVIAGTASALGTFNFTVRATANGYFAEHAYSIVIGQGTPIISVTAPSPNIVGNQVEYSVTVKPAGVDVISPTGTVQFRLGTTAIGEPVALVNGAAQLTLAAPASGLYAVSAVYSGDANYLAGSKGAANNLIVFQFSIRDDTSESFLLFNGTAAGRVPAGGFEAATCGPRFPPPPPPVTGAGAVSSARCQIILNFQLNSTNRQAVLNTCLNQGVVTNGAPLNPTIYLRDSNTSNNTSFCR